MKSISDENILPEQPGRIRAFVHKAAYIMRPNKADRGLELTVCNHSDPGGIVPAWSQSILTRFAAQRAQQWSNKLHEHCLGMRQRAKARAVRPPVSQLA